MEPIFITAIVFYGFYQIIRLISGHFLKRKLSTTVMWSKPEF